jgi:hypothetical protein
LIDCGRCGAVTLIILPALPALRSSFSFDTAPVMPVTGDRFHVRQIKEKGKGKGKGKAREAAGSGDNEMC